MFSSFVCTLQLSSAHHCESIEAQIGLLASVHHFDWHAVTSALVSSFLVRHFLFYFTRLIILASVSIRHNMLII